MKPKTAHAVLRDRREWLGSRAGLSIDRDGELTLARVPGPGNGKAIDISTTYPYTREVSGLAVGGCGAVFVADTAHDRILFVDGLCTAQVWLPPETGPMDAPGHFRSPRGLALGADALFVADTGNARVQSLALPHLEAHVAWAHWAQPTSIAIDSTQRVVVVDAATRTVHRISAAGIADGAFDATIAAQGNLQTPLFVACGPNDRLFVSDSQANAVFVFDASGVFLFALQGPAGWQPGALAVHGARAYVAEAGSGSILVFDVDSAPTPPAGVVHGWRGPVTALTCGVNGDLYIKPGLDAVYHRFSTDAAYVAQGTLVAGPFDAGVERAWDRAWVEAHLPAGASLEVSVALKSTDAPATDPDWQPLPSFDALLSLDPFKLKSRRFISVRLLLTTEAPQISPRLRQARAATAAEDLRDYLPLTYRRSDEDVDAYGQISQDADPFLSRWLKLLRGEFGAIEELLDDMPRISDPQFAPTSALTWLTQWLELELPRIATDEQRRALLARAVQLYARRGTKESIAEFVELYTGIRPTIVEAFPDRRIWMLGASSRLDFDTRLPALDPLGMVVPDENAGDGCCPDIGQVDASACSPCKPKETTALAPSTVTTPIGRAVVGESGPLASHQLGMPLYAESAYRFCVIVDSYRAHDQATRDEIKRIVEREKPAHTDYRLDLIAPETHVGLQAQIGVDFIIGGDPPSLRLTPAQIGVDTQLAPSEVARIGESTLDGSLTLT